MSELRARLEKIIEGLRNGNLNVPVRSLVPSDAGQATDQLDVLERQVSVLENAATRLIEATAVHRNVELQFAS